MTYNIFSKRIEKENNKNEIYEYDDIPERLRMQVIYILDDLCGTADIWSYVEKKLLREYGEEFLGGKFIRDSKESCHSFIKTVENIENFFDIIELAIQEVEKNIEDYFYGEMYYIEYYKLDISPKEAIEELNHRFKENNFGYEVIDGQIIRIDRKFTHNKIVKSALNLLFEEEFESGNEEFLIAHKYYKEGCSKAKANPNEDFKSAIINCNKAFESTMKIICEKKRELVSTYDSKHEAKRLINDLVDANIIPKHLENNFHGVRNMLKGIRDSLENGLPVIRNKVGHGKGTEEEWISEEFVTYSINLAATNIVLLVDLYKQL